MSTLNELAWLLGTGVENPEVLYKTVSDVLKFSLLTNARERQSIVVSMGFEWQSKRVKLSWRDVGQGVVIVWLLGNLEVDPVVRLKTTQCLADLAESYENQLTIASYSTVLDVLMNQLQKGYSVSVREHTIPAAVLTLSQKGYSTSLQVHTARCLANLAQTQKNHMRMASSSVLDPLVKILLETDVQPQVHQQAVRCLTNLAVSKQNKERIGNYPCVLAALGTLLRKHGNPGGSSGVHKQIINCLTSLASSENIQVKIVSNSPMLNALVRLLGENRTSDVQRESLKCLTALCEHYRSQVDMASHPGVLNALLRLLKCNSITTDKIKVQVEAARCLLKLLSAPENLLKIASHDGAFDSLVICIYPSWRRRAVRNLAIECLSNLAGATENQLKMVNFKIDEYPGLVSALVSQLVQVENSDGQERQPVQEKNSDGRELAAWCLSKLAIARETKEPLTSSPGLLKSLVAVLNKPNSTLVEPALNCLVNLAQSDEFTVRKKITFHRGVIDALVRLLGSNLDRNLLELTAQCLSDLALSPLNAKQIVSHPKVLDTLVKLLRHNTNTNLVVLQYTAKCLTNLACLEESQMKMASFPGMLDALVLSLGVANKLTQGVQEQVVNCLAQLSVPQENHSKIASFPGVHDALLRQLATGKAHRRAAIKCLASLKLSPVAAKEPRNSLRYKKGRAVRNLWDSLSDPDDWRVDPITYEIMCDPVKCNDGVTYDRWTIIDNGIQESPYNRSLTKFFIACDDIDVRRRLFHKIPQQEVKFRGLRETYRKKALRSARALDFEDAIEKLNNVLMWAPSDTECKTELDNLLSRVNEQSCSLDPGFDTEPPQSLLVFPESPQHNNGVPFEIDIDSTSTIPLLPHGEQTSIIPVLLHEDVMRVREKEGSRKALFYVIFVFSLYFAIFIFI